MKVKFLITTFFLCALAFFAQRAFYKPKVFDCFLFFNEFDVLDVRLEELCDKVDRFILVESTKGFTNQPKPLYFAENKERYAKYQDKIVHVVIDKFPPFGPIGDGDYWEIENFQRDQILQGLKKCQPHNRDIVLITDVDEIIRSKHIDKIKRLIDKRKEDVVFGEFDQYQFFFNRKQPRTWQIAIATSWENLSKYIRSCQDFRNLSGFTKGHSDNGFDTLEKAKKIDPKKKWAFARLKNAGWHFTSIGTHEKYLEKVKNYSHVNANHEENKKFENILEVVNHLKHCELDQTFPRYLVDQQELFKSKGLIDEPLTLFR